MRPSPSGGLSGTFDTVATVGQRIKLGPMFAAEDIDIQLSLDEAKERLMCLVSGGGLSMASRNAYEDGLEHLTRVGPLGEVPGLSKLVKISFVEPLYSQDSMTLGFRGEATGVTGSRFPGFDGDLTVSRIDEQLTRVALVGSYRPPLGPLGAGLDRAIMGKVSDATIRALLRDVATALTGADAPADKPR